MKARFTIRLPAIIYLVGIAAALCAPQPVRGEPLRFDGFEQYGLGSIDEEDMRWDVSAFGIGSVINATDHVHTDEQALAVGVYETWPRRDGDVRWFNETGRNFGGDLQLSWWMEPLNPWWHIYVYGKEQGNVRGVLGLTTREGQSTSTLDVLLDDGNWIELLEAYIHGGVWTQVLLNVDFRANPDEYTVRVRRDDGYESPTFGPYTLGNDTDFFHSLSLYSTWAFEDRINFYFDDFAIVPEPSTLLLAFAGCLAAGMGWCWRRKKP